MPGIAAIREGASTLFGAGWSRSGSRLAFEWPAVNDIVSIVPRRGDGGFPEFEEIGSMLRTARTMMDAVFREGTVAGCAQGGGRGIWRIDPSALRRVSHADASAASNGPSAWRRGSGMMYVGAHATDYSVVRQSLEA